MQKRLHPQRTQAPNPRGTTFVLRAANGTNLPRPPISPQQLSRVNGRTRHGLYTPHQWVYFLLRLRGDVQTNQQWAARTLPAFSESRPGLTPPLHCPTTIYV